LFKLHELGRKEKYLDLNRNAIVQKKVAGIEENWKSYTCFSANYLEGPRGKIILAVKAVNRQKDRPSITFMSVIIAEFVSER